jgi:hypothetical protein
LPDTSGAVPLGQQPGKPEQQKLPSGVNLADYPPALPAALREKWREMRRTQELNSASEQDLAAHGAQIPPWEVVRLQMRSLLDMVFPLDDPEGAANRLVFETIYQNKLAGQWDGLKSQVVQAILARGGMMDPAMAEHMQRMQAQSPGLFGNQRPH